MTAAKHELSIPIVICAVFGPYPTADPRGGSGAPHVTITVPAHIIPQGEDKDD